MRNRNMPKGVMDQQQFLEASGSRKITEPMLAIPDSVVPTATNISTTPTKVKKGTICRIRVTALTYVIFRDDGTVTSAPTITDTAVELPVAGTYCVVATGDFIMASANPARLELIEN